MKRLVAVLAALAMVAGAFLVRGWLDDRDEPSASNGAPPVGDEQLTLLCDPSLRSVCDQLDEARADVTVEVADSAGAMSRLTDAAFPADDDPVDGWLVPAPFPDMVEESRQRAGQSPVFGDVGPPLARSPLVIAMWNERADALAPTCTDDEVGWRCIGDGAGVAWGELGGSAAWGRLKPGFDDPDTSATGLLVVGQASADFFETPGFASNDFDQNGFRGWLRNLEESVPAFPATAGTPLDQMLSAGPAAYDLVGTTEAEAGPAVASSRDRDRLRVIYPAPMATADVLFAPIARADGAERLGEIVSDDTTADLLAAAGWRVEGRPLADGLDAGIELPPDNGLPRAGVLQALRNL